jgi:curli biogenesis system outer membrane secretion channel CsgG
MSVHTWARKATLALALTALFGCATEQSRTIEVPRPVATAPSANQGPRAPIAVGKFENRSSFMRGMFADAVDRLGSQSKSILIAHLQQSNRFSVLDRDNLEEAQQEAKFKAGTLNIKGADFLVTGAVTEFGRKEVGDQQLFGVLGRGKKQVAYAKVTLNVVNSQTSEVVYSSQGAGEFELSTREVVGFGGTAGYDATLNGKVLDLAIREAVNGLVSAVDSGAWKPQAR